MKGQVDLAVLLFIVLIGVFALTIFEGIYNVVNAAGIQREIDLAYQISDEGSALSSLFNSRSGGEDFIEKLGKYAADEGEEARDSVSEMLASLGESYKMDLITEDGVKTFKKGIVVDQQGPMELAMLTTSEELILNQEGWRWPVGDENRLISSGIGMRKFYGVCRLHQGIDIALPVGTAVYAAAEGTVVFAGEQEDFGKVITIEHIVGDRFYYTYYGHLDHILVKEGQRVDAGEKIALSGNTGRSTGPHLHFDMSTGRGTGRQAVDICPLLDDPANCYQETGFECVVASGEGGVRAEIPLPGAVKGKSKAEVRLVV